MNRKDSVSLYRAIALAFYGIGMAVVLLGFLNFESNMEDVFQWLPDETADRETYNQFVERFGVDDFLVVTWPGCVVSDKRCDQFASALAKDNSGLIEQAVSGRELIRQLMGSHKQSPREIVERFRGIYFGPDGKSTCIVVMLTQDGMNRRIDTVELMKRTASESIGVSEQQIVLAGYPQMGAYGDAIVRTSIRDLVGPSCVLSTVVAWLCLRNIGLTIALLAIGGLASSLSIAIVTLSGAKWGGLSSAIPALAYILSVSGALHLVNYARSAGDDRLYFRVLRIGWKPCVLSALTTAAGMLSLCRSEFPAIREFGFYCATGVLASLACQLILIPVAIDWLQPKELTTLDRPTPPRFLAALIDRAGLVVAVFIGLSLLVGAGLHRLRSDLEVERNFSRSAPVMQDIAWLEENIGPVEQTELQITFHGVDETGFDERFRAIGALQEKLVAKENASAGISVASWVPDEPRGATMRKAAARSAYRKMLVASRHDFADTSYLHIHGDSETWRVSLRFPFLQSTDFNHIKSSIPILAERELEETIPDGNIEVTHTGVSLLYHVAQERLVADLYRNFTTAFLFIWPLMMIVLRSIKLGAVAMIPNVCPAVIAYGLLGWFDIAIDIGMAMTACVALGIAVDDTTHFMLRFQDIERDLTASGSLQPASGALSASFRQCSRAMLHTTLITGFGLAPFLFGPLAAMTRFACLLIVMILIALACDLVLLPALLRRMRPEKTVGSD